MKRHLNQIDEQNENIEQVKEVVYEIKYTIIELYLIFDISNKIEKALRRLNYHESEFRQIFLEVLEQLVKINKLNITFDWEVIKMTREYYERIHKLFHSSIKKFENSELWAFQVVLRVFQEEIAKNTIRSVCNRNNFLNEVNTEKEAVKIIQKLFNFPQVFKSVQNAGPFSLLPAKLSYYFFIHQNLIEMLSTKCDSFMKLKNSLSKKLKKDLKKFPHVNKFLSPEFKSTDLKFITVLPLCLKEVICSYLIVTKDDVLQRIEQCCQYELSNVANVTNLLLFPTEEAKVMI